jgi:hypothetical protein
LASRSIVSHVTTASFWRATRQMAPTVQAGHLAAESNNIAAPPCRGGSWDRQRGSNSRRLNEGVGLGVAA